MDQITTPLNAEEQRQAPPPPMRVTVMNKAQGEDPIAAAFMSELSAIVGQLESTVRKREGQRNSIEKRWLEDLAQFHGRYDSETAARIRQNETSSLFINLTRPKTEAMSARLQDLLFPTDEKNWGINPTPVPELVQEADQKAAEYAEKRTQAMMAEQQAGQDPQAQAQAQAMAFQADQAAEEERLLRARMSEAAKRSKLMEKEIEDQLQESGYHSAMRRVIEDACKTGTGVSKGPVTGVPTRLGWKQSTKGDSYSLEMSDGNRPGIRYVNYWDYYPDMSVNNSSEGMGDFEQHLMTRRQLRELARLPGFNVDAIKELLAGAFSSPPSYLQELRTIRGEALSVQSEFYLVWEYSGPMEPEDMQKLANAFTREGQEAPEIDPLTDVKAIVWFCEGKVLKFAIYPFDSQEAMYSVYNLVKDEHTPFGYGMPWIMRDLQKAVNAGWRGMMDNAAIASGPQLVIDREKISPMDGKWTLTPRKVWEITQPWTQPNPPFWSIDIPMMQAEMANIVMFAEKLMDDVTGMPKIAQGDQSGQTTKTAGGMTLLMNSANVVFRRMVRNFDDDVTVPTLRRFYDWNMQHNQREDIKGDFQVDARGSSVLLAREIQSQNLFSIALQLGPHPVYGPMLQNRNVLRKLLQAQMLSSDELMLDDEEIDAILAAAAAAQQDQSQQMEQQMRQAEMKLRMRELEIKADEIDAKIAIANMQRDEAMLQADGKYRVELEKAAASGNAKLDELEAKERIKQREIDSKERLAAAEYAYTKEHSKNGEPSGGGYV